MGSVELPYRRFSVYLGSLFGIRIQLSYFFILFALSILLFFGVARNQFWIQLGLIGMLFLLVLLHEFGHCFACRAVGGDADEILIWPLGGLAMVQPPHRPMEYLLTILGGPAVNLVLGLLALPVLIVNGMAGVELWNPFYWMFPDSSLGLAWVFLFVKLNYVLLLLNLMPVYPMDGGRIVQSALWFTMDELRATRISTTTGMVLGVFLAAVSLWWNDLMLFTIFAFGAFESWRTRQMAEWGAFADNEFGYDFSQGYTSLERSMPGGQKIKTNSSLRARLGGWLQRRRKQHEEWLEAELDRILIKIKTDGMASLSRGERRILNQASRKRRH